MRTDKEILLKAVLVWRQSSQRRKGRSKITLHRTVLSEGIVANIDDLKTAEQAAANKERWKILVSAICAMFDTGG